MCNHPADGKAFTYSHARFHGQQCVTTGCQYCICRSVKIAIGERGVRVYCPTCGETSPNPLAVTSFFSLPAIDKGPLIRPLKAGIRAMYASALYTAHFRLNDIKDNLPALVVLRDHSRIFAMASVASRLIADIAGAAVDVCREECRTVIVEHLQVSPQELFPLVVAQLFEFAKVAARLRSISTSVPHLPEHFADPAHRHVNLGRDTYWVRATAQLEEPPSSAYDTWVRDRPAITPREKLIALEHSLMPLVQALRLEAADSFAALAEAALFCVKLAHPLAADDEPPSKRPR